MEGNRASFTEARIRVRTNAIAKEKEIRGTASQRMLSNFKGTDEFQY